MPYFMVAKVVFDESVHSLKYFRVLIFNIAIRRFGIGGQNFYIHAISVPDFYVTLIFGTTLSILTR